MPCAYCGASAIAGATRCYRCSRPFDAAPSFDDLGFSPVERPARVPAAPRVGRRTTAPAAWRRLVAPVASWILAALAVLDYAMGDPPGILLLGGAHVLLGVALLLGWRGARGTGWAFYGVGVVLGLLAIVGGGYVTGPVVVLLSGAGLVGLARGPRGPMASRRRAREHSS
jgi:hypothetical protein